MRKSPSRIEHKDGKADRLLCQQRVRVLTADESSVAARVQGDSGTYDVWMYVEGGELRKECTCPYSDYHPMKDCSHVLAVSRVWKMEG